MTPGALFTPTPTGVERASKHAAAKPRIRLVAVGQTMYRRIRRDRGWGGPYGQQRQPAKWACIHCGKTIGGDDTHPWLARHDITGRFDEPCADNGHAPCSRCGKNLPRLMDGCPREHNWRACPGKTESDRMQPQHTDNRHRERSVS